MRHISGDASFSGYLPPERIGFQRVSSAQRRRLDATAKDVLGHYAALQNAHFSLFATHSNVTYRVDVPGQRYALRIGAPPTLECVDVPSELMWMAAVREAGISVPTPLENEQGSFITIVRNRDTEELSQCVIFTWLPGRPAAEDLTERSCWHIGRVSSALHNFSDAWNVPAILGGLLWDHVFYYPGIPVRLLEAQNHLITPELRRMIAFLVERADATLHHLYASSTPKPIHGNIESWNVLIDGERASLIDFEELTFGFPIQDIAVTLHYLRSHPRYDVLSEAYRHGYEEQRDWPADHQQLIPLLSAARTLMLMNHAINFSPDPRPFIQRSTPGLRDTARAMGC